MPPATLGFLLGAVFVSSAANFGFALPVNQGTLTATPTTQAASVVFTPSLTVVNSFCGTVNFQVTGLPTGASVTAPSVNLCANSPQTAQITVTVPPGTPQGTSQLTINAYGSNGNAGQASNQYIYPYLQVGSGGSTFSISASPPQTTAPGGTAQYTITVNGSAGLGNVTLTATGGPPGATVQLGSASVAVGGQTTLTVAVPSNAGLGTYPVKIAGILGTVPRYATAMTNITQAAPASVISPTPGQISSGQSTFTWNSGIGATQYQLSVGSSSGGTNYYSANLGTAQSAAVNIPSNATVAYVTLGSLTSIGWLTQSYVYGVPAASGGSVMQLGAISIQPGAPPVTVSSPVPSDTITGCSVPSAGVTAVIAGAAGSQTVTFAASATAQLGTTNIACSTAARNTVLLTAQIVGDADGISYVQTSQTGPGLYHLSIFGFGFGNDYDGGANVYLGGAATLNGFMWTNDVVEIDMSAPDGVCSTTFIELDPDGSEDPDDFAPAPLFTSVGLCPDVSSPPAPTAQIMMGSSVVSGNAANSPAIVSVGQQIQLTGSVINLGGLTVVSQLWTIGGTTVKSYQQTLSYTNGNISQGSSTGVSTPLGQSDLSQQSITFYWIDGDDCTNTVSYTVTYTATLSDQSKLTAPAAGFRPVRPCAVTAPQQALTFNGATTSATPAITFSPTYLSSPSMNFGTPGVNGATDIDGITFNTSPAITTTFGGAFAWLQLVNRVTTFTFTNGSTQTLNSNGFVLDNGRSASGQPQYNSNSGWLYPFNPGQKGTLPSPIDLPAVGLSGTNLSSVATNQQFQMFLMYQPSGANSIWVTLQQVNWNPAATIAFANGAWGMPTGTSFSANPMGARSTSLPQWTTAITLQQ